MAHPTLWKALALGAVFAGLGVAGAGTASADSGTASPDVRPVVAAPFAADGPFDDLDGIDDFVRWPHQIPWHLVNLDDDDWYDDDWDDD